MSNSFLAGPRQEPWGGLGSLSLSVPREVEQVWAAGRGLSRQIEMQGARICQESLKPLLSQAITYGLESFFTVDLSFTNTSINFMPLFFKGREHKSRAVAVDPGSPRATHCSCSSCWMPAGWSLQRKPLTRATSLLERIWKLSRFPASAQIPLKQEPLLSML